MRDILAGDAAERALQHLTAAVGLDDHRAAAARLQPGQRRLEQLQGLAGEIGRRIANPIDAEQQRVAEQAGEAIRRVKRPGDQIDRRGGVDAERLDDGGRLGLAIFRITKSNRP